MFEKEQINDVAINGRVELMKHTDGGPDVLSEHGITYKIVNIAPSESQRDKHTINIATIEVSHIDNIELPEKYMIRIKSPGIGNEKYVPLQTDATKFLVTENGNRYIFNAVS
jgi:hypothetical protein